MNFGRFVLYVSISSATSVPSEISSPTHTLDPETTGSGENIIPLNQDVSFEEFMSVLDPNVGPIHAPVSMPDLITRIESSDSVHEDSYESLTAGILFSIVSEAGLQPPEEIWDNYQGQRLLTIAASDFEKGVQLIIPLVVLVTNLGLDGSSAIESFATCSGFRAFCDSNRELFYHRLREDHRRNWRLRRLVGSASDGASLHAMITHKTFLSKLPPFCPGLLDDAPTDVRLIVFMHYLQRRRLTLAFGGLGTETLVDISRARAFASWFHNRSDKIGKFIGIGSVKFAHETGDGVGVTRDWFREAAEELFSESYGLFTLTPERYYLLNTEGITGRPHWRSELRAVGYFLAFAVADQIPLNANLPVWFIAFLMDRKIDLDDIRFDDMTLYRSLNELLAMEEPQLESLGLFYNRRGTDEPLGVANRYAYVEQRLRRLIPSNGPYQIIKAAFQRVIPSFPVYVRSIDVKRSITGTPAIDVDDLIANLHLHGYQLGSDQVLWLNGLLRSYSQDHLKKFISFVTGTATLPVGGFPALQHPITVVKSGEPDTHLPSTRTCFNQFFLPEYSQEDILRERVSTAIELDASMGIV